MPASGEFTFKLTGQMTHHGQDEGSDVRRAVAKRSRERADRDGDGPPTWKFADFGMTAPSVPFRVVSVVDEIRVVVDLVATVKA